MPARQARPCRVMAFWGNGGFVLGFLTALMGRQGIWICTAAVEGAVHKHLEDQLLFLRGKDPELQSLIAAIQEEELSHLNHAEERIEARTLWSRSLSAFISWSTDVAIWLSTWGDFHKDGERACGGETPVVRRVLSFSHTPARWRRASPRCRVRRETRSSPRPLPLSARRKNPLSASPCGWPACP